jgi:hypothetical protein
MNEKNDKLEKIENSPKTADETKLEEEMSKLKFAKKTGHYQATLPKDHPQAQALKTDPHAYHTYKEGEQFSLTGLEEYESDKIEWVFVK